MSRFRSWLVMMVLLSAATCGESAPQPGSAASEPTARLAPTATAGTGKVSRSVLTYDQLMDGFDFDGPVDEGAFALPLEAAPPTHTFAGRLELWGEGTGGDMQFLRGSLDPEDAHLPEFDFPFVQQRVRRSLCSGLRAGRATGPQPARPSDRAGPRPASQSRP